MKIIFFKLVAIIILCMMTCSQINAQNRNELLKTRAKEKVKQLYDYVDFVASKKKSLKMRDYYAGKTLNLFIGRGEAYTDENGKSNEGVMMQVTSVNNPTPRTKTVKRYLYDLARLNYSNVKIEATDVADMKVSNLKPIGDGVYVCTCYIVQVFSVLRDGVWRTIDTTHKYIQCYVFVEKTEDGEEYVVRLGNVYATETLPGNALQTR